MALEQFNLTNKTILITGASGDLGRQTAITASEAGAHVIITGRDESKLKQTLNLLTGDKHQIIIADLSNEDEIAKLAQQINSVDGIVHSAGKAEFFPTKFIDRKRITATYEVNFFAPVLLMTSLFKYKKINKKCSVVFLSSFSGLHPFSNGALYCSSKAAIECYSKVLAVEHIKLQLRSNTIAPAMVRTKLLEESEALAALTNANTKQIEEKYLLGYGEPIDVANLIIFLLSDASKWMTGQNIPIDGGYLRGLMP
ncbi:MAG: SDR family oxidoreductase [Chitinophagales bacterium]